MGGFLKNNEGVDEAAKRILNQLTGLSNVYMEQLYSFGELNRDPGARIISIAYFALIKINASDLELVKTHGATWIPISAMPQLIFDHSAMVERALKNYRSGQELNLLVLNFFPINLPFRNFRVYTKPYTAKHSINAIFAVSF